MRKVVIKVDNIGALIGLRLREKNLRERNSRIRNAQLGLSHFLNEHAFLLNENAEDGAVIMDKKEEIISFWKGLLQNRSQGVDDLSPEDYGKILYGVYYYISRSQRYSTEYIPDGIFRSIIDPFFNSVEFADQLITSLIIHCYFTTSASRQQLLCD